LVRQGGTTFHFVTDGIEGALDRANEAAGEKDMRIAGGANAVQQFIEAGLVDEIPRSRRQVPGRLIILAAHLFTQRPSR